VAFSKKLLVEAKIRNLKLKKNALDAVDVIKEAKNDPKFKTELCKSWVETGFCIYGNKCRFAHGKSEIFEKPVNSSKYKQKNCLSFFENGFCNYGTRCHFKHDERKVEDINILYYTSKLLIADYSYVLNSTNNTSKQPEKDNNRLQIFKDITRGNNNTNNSYNTYNNSKCNNSYMKLTVEPKSLSSESQIKHHNDNPVNSRLFSSFY